MSSLPVPSVSTTTTTSQSNSKLPTQAEKFLNSIELPNSDRATAQISQTQEKLNNTQAILTLLQESLEITQRTIPDSRDRQRLLNELHQSIQRHQILLQREQIKLSVKQDVLEHP